MKELFVYAKVSSQQLLSRYYGMSLIFLSFFLASLYPILMLLVQGSFSIAMVSFIYSISGFCFAFPRVIQRKKLHQFLSFSIIKKSITITLIINVIYFQLLLLALQYSDPVRVSVLAMSNVFFAYFIYVLLLKEEKFTLAKLLGSVLMVLGAITFIGGFSSLNSFSIGDISILIGSAIIPFAYQYQKDLSNYAANEVIISLRSIISAIIFGSWLLLFSPTEFLSIDIYSIVIIAIASLSALVLSNYAWLEGLKFVVTSRAVSFTPMQSVFTVILSIIFLGSVISITQVLGIIPLLIGTIILLNPKAILNPYIIKFISTKFFKLKIAQGEKRKEVQEEIPENNKRKSEEDRRKI